MDYRPLFWGHVAGMRPLSIPFHSSQTLKVSVSDQYSYSIPMYCCDTTCWRLHTFSNEGLLPGGGCYRLLGWPFASSSLLRHKSGLAPTSFTASRRNLPISASCMQQIPTHQNRGAGYQLVASELQPADPARLTPCNEIAPGGPMLL